ncbi:hypothetical protein BMS3Bbin04_00147 [bacterium BMS3Bbin04]|nr:hypothetical protein BMS3Bbin04_00147 [bacterium BMS3Bbin04]
MILFKRGLMTGVFALLMGLLGFTQFTAAETPLVVNAGYVDDEIRLDGILDEPAWRDAGFISNLTQQDPHPGEPTQFQTEVMLLVDDENLYVGVTCFDPDPSLIAVHTMQRDGNLYGDETISLVLDTFGDRRRGYFFQVNAVGARLDGLISGSGDVSNDWDGIWDVRTRRTPDGWTAEIRIPAQTLRFTPGAASWGFNIQRRVARDRVTMRWAGATLDAQLEDLSRAGRLKGITGLKQGKGLSVSPYGLVRREADLMEDHSSVQGDGGLDVMYNLTSDLTAVLTINSDFAETDVDNRQVNLTRFPLFFPEKRAFFVEGSNLFTFGSGTGHDFIPFFSRRVGLFNGQQIPLLGGAKVLGQAGKVSLAALDASTGDAPETASTNLFAGRIAYDVSDQLTVGTIFTNGDPDGVHDNTLLGVDARWQTSSFHRNKNLSVGGWAAYTDGDIPDGRKTGWGLKLDYPNDLWDVYAIYKEFGDALDPALGFLPRPGTRWYQGGGAYQPRPDGGFFDWVRQFYFETYFTYVEDLDQRAESWRLFTAPFNAQTESGEHLEANVAPQFERLDEPFEIAEGVVIPAGDYQFNRYRVEAQTSRHRPWRVGSTVWFGEFYTGTLTQWESFASYTTLGGHLRLELQSEHNYGQLPEGNFTQDLWQLDMAYAFTPDLILSSYTQYDSESRNLGTNTRLRWTFRPGDDLYIVWNNGWEQPIGNRNQFAFEPASNQIVVKLRWTFRG